MIDWRIILRDLLNCKGDLQLFINQRYKAREEGIIPIDSRLFNRVISKSDLVFHINHNVNTMSSTAYEYRYDDITKDTVVLDIGANVGTFALTAAKLSDHVFAVEPFLTDELRKNVALNNSNVTVIDGGLGDGSMQTGMWEGKTKTFQTYTLGELIVMCGGKVDFLKCDCEGPEWFINPNDLMRIPRLEMELHFLPEYRRQFWLLDFIKEQYAIEISDAQFPDPRFKILRARRKVER